LNYEFTWFSFAAISDCNVVDEICSVKSKYYWLLQDVRFYYSLDLGSHVLNGY